MMSNVQNDKTNNELEERFQEVYSKFKLNFYRGIFDRISERVGSLTATEAFAVEAIYALREPRVGEFAEAIGISQPNATYRVNSLIKKGYVEKINSETDKRDTISELLKSSWTTIT